MNKRALIIIDVQNDYFPGGQFPLWNTEKTLGQVLRAVELARAKHVPVVMVQHIADKKMGPGPFFNEGTDGANIHSALLAAAPDAAVVVKRFADGFFDTTLEATLTDLGATELLICGMMTQNCVTHTAISKSAEKYGVKVLTDGCTTVSEILHQIALHALSTRIPLVAANEAFAD
jgi:nicotinamidase-related amidase